MLGAASAAAAGCGGDALEEGAAVEARGAPARDHDGEAAVGAAGEESGGFGQAGDATGDAAEDLHADLVEDGDGAVVGIGGGGGGEIGGGRVGEAAAGVPQGLARVAELAAELLDGGGDVARAAGEGAAEIAEDGGLVPELAAGARAGGEGDARLALVALDAEDAQEPDLRCARAVGATAGRDVEIADGDDADVLGDLGGAPQRERRELFRRGKEGADGGVVVDDGVDEGLGLGDEALVERLAIDVDGAGGLAEARRDGGRKGDVGEARESMCCPVCSAMWTRRRPRSTLPAIEAADVEGAPPSRR